MTFLTFHRFDSAGLTALLKITSVEVFTLASFDSPGSHGWFHRFMAKFGSCRHMLSYLNMTCSTCQKVFFFFNHGPPHLKRPPLCLSERRWWLTVQRSHLRLQHVFCPDLLKVAEGPQSNTFIGKVGDREGKIWLGGNDVTRTQMKLWNHS